jgi:hypothetical protein
VAEPSDRTRVSEPPRGAPLGEPGASTPRWLAWVVLVALLASGALSTWLILAPEPDASASAPPSAAASD